MRSYATVVALLVVMVGSGSAAWAQTPGGDAYGGQGDVAADVTNRGDLAPVPAGDNEGNAPAPAGGTGPARIAASPGSGSGSSLPFTGFDVLLLVAGGMVLIGVGVGIRRFTPKVYE